jgi:hypothetical protein
VRLCHEQCGAVQSLIVAPYSARIPPQPCLVALPHTLSLSVLLTRSQPAQQPRFLSLKVFPQLLQKVL